MLRVKDPETSLRFYQEVMGMTLLRTIKNAAARFDLYYLGYGCTKDEAATAEATARQEGLLQLTWEYGTEKQENFKYHNGNEEPQGFGHICKPSH
jgi:lactoylglutathione lyase